MLKLVASPLEGLTGVTVISGVMFSDQLESTPVVPVLALVIWSCQVPSATLPWRLLSVTVEFSGYSGRNVPVNGAEPPAMGLVAAESSRTVLMKLAPEPPKPENRGTWVPSGAISTAVSAESVWNAMLSWRVTLATLNVLLELGTVRGTVRTPGPEELAAGIVWAMA